MAGNDFSTPLLNTDPGVIALGVEPGDPALAAAAGDPSGPACQSARAGYRTALMFQILFTSLVFIVALASAAALVISIARIIDNGANVTAVVAGLAGVVGSGVTIFLVKHMNGSIKVAKAALADVGRYCGTSFTEKL